MNTYVKTSDRVDIRLEISEHGIDRAVVSADNDVQQTTAHLLLARITPELRQLNDAIRAKNA